jgi:hypothetical protein
MSNTFFASAISFDFKVVIFYKSKVARANPAAG